MQGYAKERVVEPPNPKADKVVERYETIDYPEEVKVKVIVPPDRSTHPHQDPPARPKES